MYKSGMIALAAVAGMLAFTAQLRPQDAFSDVQNSQGNMTYYLTHPLHEIKATSDDVHFRISVSPKDHAIKNVLGYVDVTTFSSGNSNRDSHAMEVVDAIDYPDARFVGASVSKTADTAFVVQGNLTFHGVTKPVAIPITAKWSQGRFDVSGSFNISLTAFKIQRPSLLMVPVEDKLSFTFWAAFLY